MCARHANMFQAFYLAGQVLWFVILVRNMSEALSVVVCDLG